MASISAALRSQSKADASGSSSEGAACAPGSVMGASRRARGSESVPRDSDRDTSRFSESRSSPPRPLGIWLSGSLREEWDEERQVV